MFVNSNSIIDYLITILNEEEKFSEELTFSRSSREDIYKKIKEYENLTCE